MSGRRVLLLLDVLHPAHDAAAHALTAAAGGALFALAVIDREVVRPLRGKLGDVGFLGEEQTRGIVDALVADQREQAQAQIADLAAAARRAGVPFEGGVREGDFVETCLTEIRARRADLVIVPGKKRSRFARLLGESRLDALEAHAASTFEYVGD